MLANVSYSDIKSAHARIKPYVKKTPIVTSGLLNEWLGHKIYFKAECLQTVGAFKLRGATNFIAKLAENNNLPQQFVANSSGNHAQAVAYAAKQFNTKATIFSAQNISGVKAAATEYYGAKLSLFDNRQLADKAVKEASLQENTIWIPPFNHPDIIAGQGTVAYEALQQCNNQIDAVFAPCGGGGLLSGTKICAKKIKPDISVIGAEPLEANDAAQSLRNNQIVYIDKNIVTLADGAATPSVGEHTFSHLKDLDDFFEVNESKIAYWTQWLQHLLKLHIEPTCAMSMQAVVDWLKKQNPNKKLHILVIISGGNISAKSMQNIWRVDYLDNPPSINI